MVVYRINLFDWRTEYYQKKEKNFYILGVFSVVLAFSLFGMLYFFSQSKIDQQLARNQKIDEQIKTIDKKILAINQIKAKHEALLKQLQSIAKIKKNKYQNINTSNGHEVFRYGIVIRIKLKLASGINDIIKITLTPIIRKIIKRLDLLIF